MKVLYVGGADEFSQALINRFVKEDDEVYLVAKQNFAKEQKPFLHYKYYSSEHDGLEAEKIFSSVNPTVVIFGGEDLMRRDWTSRIATNRYIARLNQWLGLCVTSKCSFVLLSTTEVYGDSNQLCDESSVTAPQTPKGCTCLVAEDMVMRYAEIGSFTYSILRCGDIYNYRYMQQGNTLIDMIGNSVLDAAQLSVDNDILLQPIATGDLVDALKRVLDKSRSFRLNLCASEPVLLSELYKAAAKRLGSTCEVTVQLPATGGGVTNQAAKLELEWSDHKNLQQQLEHDTLPRTQPKHAPEADATTKKKTMRPVGRFVEHLVLFILFCGLSVLSHDNVMFAAVNWMMLYIVIVSLFYGTMHSFLSIFLAGIVYFVSQDLQITQLSNFYSYVGGIVKVIEYIFTGIMVSYTVDMLREELRSRDASKTLLLAERQQLEAINDENVRIKNEYEKRLLSAKTSLPKLYSIISRINVLQPNKIFSEVLNVVVDIMDTDTVSVYVMRPNSSYLRLITSLNERSAFGGKSWNLADYPHIYQALQQNELYVGNRLENEPAFVAPIFSGNRCIAVILLMEMPFSGQSLYHTNLLRTLSVLVSEAVSKALEYEQRVRQTRYLEGTDVLSAQEFEQMVSLSREKKEMGMADYCIIECDPPQDAPTLELFCQRLTGLLRDTDYMGDGGNSKLHILLPNNTEQEGAHVIQRLQDRQLTARIL